MPKPTAQGDRIEEEKRAKAMVEEIAINIAKLSRQVGAILEGRLKKRSLVILLAHTSKMSHYQVEAVLDAIANLEKTHLK